MFGNNSEDKLQFPSPMSELPAFDLNSSGLLLFKFDSWKHNVSEEDVLEVLALPHAAQSWLITLYTLTILLALLGNLLAITVLALGNRSKTDLTRYLLNLAMADMCMTCFCMPFTFTKVMLGRWVFGAVLCPTVLFSQVASVTASIYTNVAIGIDRYLVVTAPLKKRVNKPRPPVVIACIWVLAVAIASVQLGIARVQKRDFEGIIYYQCAELWTTYRDRNIFNTSMFLLTYLLPLLILGFTYYRVGVALWYRETPGNADAHRDRLRILSKRKVTKMLILIVVMFLVCWLPIQLFILLVDLAPSLLAIKTQWEEHVYLGVYIACHWMAMSNSFINPIIYSFLNETFRLDLRYLMRRLRRACCPCIFKGEVWRQASHMSGFSRQAGSSASRNSAEFSTAYPDAKRHVVNQPLVTPQRKCNTYIVVNKDKPSVTKQDSNHML